jgi:SPP1 gp7 family putative phage head morphogenesis protein
VSPVPAGLDLNEAIELLKTALSKTWTKQRREFLIETLREAETLGAWEPLDKAEPARIVERAGRVLGVDLADAVKRPVLEADMSAYRAGLRSVSAYFGFMLPDLEALDVLRGQTLFWVRNAFDHQIQDEMVRVLEDYFAQGKTRIELAARLEEFMTGREPKMRNYFDLLADHNATRIGELGHVSGYERAGVEYAEIVAVLDDRTSPICRHLHGRIVPMDALSAQKERLLSAAKTLDTEAAKKAQPMLSGASEAMILLEPRTSKIIAQGIGMPPYHFRCRTTTVAHFEPADYWEKASHWAIDGEIPKAEQPRLIDYAKNARWGSHKRLWEKARGGDGREHPTSFVHFNIHAPEMGIPTMEEYNQGWISLIRRAGRDVYLTIEKKEHPYPQLVFHDAHTREVVIVNLKGQQIASYYKKSGFDKQLRKRYAVVQQLEDARKIQKWIKFIRI